MNNITYIDKEKNAQIAASIFGAISGAASAVGGGIGDLTASTADLGAMISDMISGFTVKTKSYLFQLDWNEETQAIFYDKYWCDSTMHADTIKSRVNKLLRADEFKLKYIGDYSARSQKTVMRGLHNDIDVIKKVCFRALDKNIVELQKELEVFRLKTPISSVSENGEVTAFIGMKEGATSKSQFEVLERRENEKGDARYRRVGTLKVVKNKIWDNRFMSTEEQADGANLKYTTFKIKTGSNIYPGMLIRQTKF